MEEDGILDRRGVAQGSDLDLDAGLPKALAAPGGDRVGIAHGGDDPA